MLSVFSFSTFFYHLDREITENLFTVTENIFLKENWDCATCATAWTLANINNYLNNYTDTEHK